MTLNKAQRLVKLLELVTRPGGVRASELVERFEIDPRSLRRYLADLRDIDLPIVDKNRGGERVLEVDPRWRRTGVTLSLAEVLSLHFGRRLFNFLQGTSFASDMDGALERLEPAIPRAHAELSKQLDRSFVARAEHAKDYAGEASEIIDDLVTALIYRNPMDVTYRRADDVTRSYRLHPYTLVTYRQGLYVLALDARAALVKTYAVERMTAATRLHREKFELPASWDPEAHLAHAFGIQGGTPVRVVVAFSPAVRTYITERRWHGSQQLTRRPDGWLELAMDVAETPEVLSWVLSFGRDARVLSPDSLRQRVLEEAKRMVQAAESPR